MEILVHIYETGPTGHVAWEIGDDYVSFQPSDHVVCDLGSREVPLPGGAITGPERARLAQYRTRSEDEAKYLTGGRSATIIAVQSCDPERGARFTAELIDSDFPYILWDTQHVATINCVSTSILMFAAMMPPPAWPSEWDSKWGHLFHRIREISGEGGDWVGHVLQNPHPDLRYVSQFRTMIEEWNAAIARDEDAAAAQPDEEQQD